MQLDAYVAGVGMTHFGKHLDTGLKALGADFDLPILLCSHLHPSDKGALVRQLAAQTSLTVTEACDKQPIRPGVVHVAPSNYHLLVERDRTLALSTAVRRRGLVSGSPPPRRAAMVSSRMTLVKSLPLFASVAPFLCLIECHLECPDIWLLLGTFGSV